MMRALLLTALLACAVPTVAAAETFHVDDSRSQVLGPTLQLKPAPPPARGAAAWTLSGIVSVIVRLDVSPWKGRQARIYMTLPQQPDALITATWTTRGRLQAGTLRSGERTLVYAGPIMADSLEDTLRLQIQADGRRLQRDAQLDFSFEIDLGAS